MRDDDSPIYAFREFRLDPGARELRRGADRVVLTAKAFDLLLALVRRQGEIVPREELIAALWPDSHVEESNLTQTVFMLRNALGRSPGETYVATVPGRGYRFVPEVTRGRPPARMALRYGWLAVAAVAVLAVGGAAVLAPPRRPSERATLAVLPFENLTGDPAQEYFSDGMTEEMISQLGKLDPAHLGVIARTSSMQYKGRSVPLDRIVRELGVQYLLEGSVRRDADHVRVTAQLVRATDGTHLWSRDYDRERTGLLALQRDIAHEIAQEIRLSLDGDAGVVARRMTPREVEAYETYLEGRYFWNKRTVEGLEEAVRRFELSLAADPGNARAWAGLADCCALLPAYKGVPQTEYVEKARAAALRALELDPQLAEAHTSLALIVQNHDWDWEAAEAAYRRAIDLDPNYATAHHWYAEFLTWHGRFEEALMESERARRLDPLSLIIAADHGVILYHARRFDLADEKLRSVLELEPGFPRARAIQYVWVETGRYDEAIADAVRHTGTSAPWNLAYVLGRAGRTADAAAALEEASRRYAREPVDAVAMAWAHAGAGDREGALGWLERAHAQRSHGLLGLKVDPGWDVLRGEPRFRALLHAMRLDDAAGDGTPGSPPRPGS